MYWCQHNKAEFVARAGGSTFPEISKPKVRAVPVLLPPLAEQRRIVDLVSMVDAVAMASTAVAAQARTALVALLEESVAGPGEGEPIGALLQHGIGGVWGQEPGRGDVNVTVYRSTEFGEWTDLSHTTVATRSISATQLRSRSLVSGDILIEKSGGTPTRPVGRVVWVGLADPLSICSNFVHLIRPDPSKVWPRYLLWALWSWHRRGVLYQFQTASTNIRNLKTKDYFAQRLSCPPLVTQQRIATMADELKDLGHQGERVGQAAVGLRRALLRALLNGGGQLPDSYDRFLETVS
jgi:type I restriction enzyme S subunit